MGKAFIQESTLTEIGDAIRAKTGDSVLLFPSQMAAAIAGLASSGAYLWTKQGMSEEVTEASGVSYTLTTPNATRPSSEIEYSASAPVYNAEKKTWEMADSTIETLVNTDTYVPSATNVYVRLTSAPNVWYYVTSFTAGALNTADTCTKSMAYSTSYTAGIDEAVAYVSDDNENKYPDGAWSGGYYYEVFKPATVTIDGVEIGEDILLTKTGGYFYESTLPYNFYEGAAVVLDENIHIFGSNAGSAHYAKHYMWDGSAWTSVSTLPYEAITPAAVVLNGEIHIMGGTDSSANASKSHYKWSGTEWVSMSTLPSVFNTIKAIVLDGNIHIFGGTTSGSSNVKKHYMWDGSAWTSVSTLPYSIAPASVFVWDGNIHIMGGSSSYRTGHYMWDGSAWVSVETLTFAHQGGDVAVSNGVLHAMSSIKGTSDGDRTHKHTIWDGTTWTMLDPTPYEFTSGSLVELNGVIHMLGSSAETYDYTRHYIYSEVYRKAV